MTPTMTCPHCLHAVFPQVALVDLRADADTPAVGGPVVVWRVKHSLCPACNRITVWLGRGRAGVPAEFADPKMVRPKGSGRAPLSSDVPAAFSGDYQEAAVVLSDSPKASAALSRRCLQHLIREKAGIKRKDLATEIEELINAKTLPEHLSGDLDSVRNVGNFAAHPTKSTSTGEIVPVEPGEAEWLLDTLEGLFDFYFVQPAAAQKKREALNKKLADAGKPPMK